MEELKAKIKELEDKVIKLEGQFSDYDKTEGLKDRFFENMVVVADLPATEYATTKNLTLTGEAQTIAVVDQSKLPKVTGTLTLVYKGKRYKLLYE